jgi:hypothetical protein
MTSTSAQSEAMELLADLTFGEGWRTRMYAETSRTFGVQPTARQVADILRKRTSAT